MDSLRPKVTWRSPFGYFAWPGYLGCLCTGGKVSVVTLKHICELSWVCLAWSLEISLHPFQTGHPLLLLPNFLPNRFKLFGKDSLLCLCSFFIFKMRMIIEPAPQVVIKCNVLMLIKFLKQVYLNLFHDVFCFVSIKIRKEVVYSELNAVLCKKEFWLILNSYVHSSYWKSSL